MLQQVFPQISCVAPYVEVELLLYSPCQFCHFSRLEEGVATRERDRELVVLYHFQQVIDAGGLPLVDVPCLWVVATRALMDAACEIDGCPQAGSVNGCAF